MLSLLLMMSICRPGCIHGCSAASSDQHPGNQQPSLILDCLPLHATALHSATIPPKTLKLNHKPQCASHPDMNLHRFMLQSRCMLLGNQIHSAKMHPRSMWVEADALLQDQHRLDNTEARRVTEAFAVVHLKEFDRRYAVVPVALCPYGVGRKAERQLLILHNIPALLRSALLPGTRSHSRRLQLSITRAAAA